MTGSGRGGSSWDVKRLPCSVEASPRSVSVFNVFSVLTPFNDHSRRPRLLMGLMINVPVLPTEARFEKIAASDEVGMTVTVNDVKSFAMAVNLNAIQEIPCQEVTWISKGETTRF